MKQIGRYRLDRVLGSGAFATVWQGYDPELDVDVAIKVLADNWGANADVRERFLTEARLLRRIQSPRVVRVHDVGVTPAVGGQLGQPYFVMDYIEGGPLTELVGKLPTDEAIRLAREAAEAVQVLHDSGIIHRDLKPGNFLTDIRYVPLRVLVADLGSAKKLADATGFTVTTGSPAYMAPEQADQLGGFDSRADVYALGVVTYELLTGHRPFAGLNAGELMMRTNEVVPEPIAERLGLPAEFDTVLARALDPDPEGRPPDAQSFGTALLTAASALPGGPIEADLPTTTFRLPSTPPRDEVPRIGRGADSWIPGSVGGELSRGQDWLRIERPDPQPAPAGAASSDRQAPIPARTPTTARRRSGWPVSLVIVVAVLLFVVAAGISWLLG